MSKIRLLSIAVVALLLINLSIGAVFLLGKPAHPFEGKPPFAREGPRNIIIERLHFDKEQVAEYENLINQHQAAIRKIEDSVRLAKNLLYKTLTDKSSPGKDSLVNELSALQKKIELTHYDHFMALRKICKPDQIDDYDKLTKDLARFFARGKKDSQLPRD